MNCRICNRSCTPLFTLDNQPAGVQHLPDTPDSKGITLNVVQCTGCGLVQLDNEPVWYWKEVIRSSHLSEKINAYAESVDSFNELEHQPNPNEYLQQLYDYRPPITITVPNCNEMQMYDYCIDHLMYFTDETLDFALQLNGFRVGMIMEVLDGTTLEATVERRPFIDASDNFDWDGLKAFVEQHFLFGIYGASHQTFALLPMMYNIRSCVKFIIDDNPDKQGKYTPATNIPIVGPEKLGELDTIIVMAGGYSDEIVKKLDTFKGSVAVLKGNKIEVIR